MKMSTWWNLGAFAVGMQLLFFPETIPKDMTLMQMRYIFLATSLISALWGIAENAGKAGKKA